MSAKNRKLVEFYDEQGAEAGEQPPAAGKTSSVNAEQMRRAEQRTDTVTRRDGTQAETSQDAAPETDAVRQREDGA